MATFIWEIVLNKLALTSPSTFPKKWNASVSAPRGEKPCIHSGRTPLCWRGRGAYEPEADRLTYSTMDGNSQHRARARLPLCEPSNMNDHEPRPEHLSIDRFPSPSTIRMGQIGGASRTNHPKRKILVVRRVELRIVLTVCRTPN
jgi:hypothetical protein